MRSLTLICLLLVVTLPAYAQDGSGETDIVSEAAEGAGATGSAAAIDTDADSEDDADDEFWADSEPENCVRVNRIRRTEIIDNETIVFFMRGGDVLVNVLRDECPRLELEGRFSYEVRGGRLCRTDFITVLETYGNRFERGFTCRLGVFHPTSAEVVELMTESSESGGQRRPGTATPIELPLPEEAADSEQSGSAEDPDSAP